MLSVLLFIVVAVVVLRSPDKRSVKRHSPELEYLKAVNSVAPPKNPGLMLILMGEFASSNLQDEGAEFFSARCWLLCSDDNTRFCSVLQRCRSSARNAGPFATSVPAKRPARPSPAPTETS